MFKFIHSSNVFRVASLIATAMLCACQTPMLKIDLAAGGKPGHYYSLPMALVEVQLVPGALVDPQKCAGQDFLTTKPKIIADPRHRYVLEYQANSMFKDVITVETSEEGLLKAVNTTTTDQAVAITNKLLELGTEISKIANKSGVDVNQASIKTQTDCKPIADYLPHAEQLKDDATSADHKIGDYTVSIKLYDKPNSDKSASSSTDAGRAGSASAPPTSPNPVPIVGSEFVWYRPLVRYVLSVTEKVETKEYVRATQVLLLPDRAQAIPLPVTRTPFVEQTLNYTFTDGSLKKTEITRPSTVAGFIDIPINLAKAIISIPAALLDFKITNTKKEASLADEQTKLLQKQATLLEELVKQQNKN